MTSKVAPIEDFIAQVSVADLEFDPYGTFARLRAEAPVAYVPAVDLWLVTRWQDVEYVGNNPHLFTAEMSDSPINAAFGSPNILNVDGEVHADLRRILDTKYRPRKVSGYISGLVEPIVDDCLAAVMAAGEHGAVDLLSTYFEPISVISLGKVLGLGHYDANTLRRWFRGLHQGAINYEHDPVRQRKSDQTAAEIDQALTPLFEALAAVADDSTISHMLHAGMQEGERRDIATILPSLKVIILGGMQEPGHGAATTLYGLLSNPEALMSVRSDLAGRVPAAIEEGLRWVSPIGTQAREVLQPVELGGVELAAGARVAAVLSSANRDESVFDEAEVFRLGRTRKSHLAFGLGVHFCAGHAFARGQMAIAVTRLLERFPNLQLDPGRPAEFQGWEFRAPRSLYVQL